MAEYMYKHPEFKHNDIMIAFTPDEEVGRGTEHFDLDIFQADYAYTIDGGDINEFHFENHDFCKTKCHRRVKFNRCCSDTSEKSIKKWLTE